MLIGLGEFPTPLCRANDAYLVAQSDLLPMQATEPISRIPEWQRLNPIFLAEEPQLLSLVPIFSEEKDGSPSG